MLKIKLLFGFLLIAAHFWAQTPACTTTEHGYRFYHHIQLGGTKPKRGETIKAYVNIFIGDTLLSSSRKSLGGTYKFDIAPADAVLEHYPPLMDAALLMGIGDSATVFQPLDTAMRRFVPKAVQNQKELRFEIALVQIINADDKAKAEQAASLRAANLKTMVQSMVQKYNSGTLNEPLTTTKSGLKMLLLERGTGKLVRVNDAVQVHYFGFLKDGTCFDNSFERHHPLAFPVGVGQMIPGFDEGVMLLPRGSKAYLFIPSTLAYGDAVAGDGLIPAHSELIFYVEIL